MSIYETTMSSSINYVVTWIVFFFIETWLNYISIII